MFFKDTTNAESAKYDTMEKKWVLEWARVDVRGELYSGKASEEGERKRRFPEHHHDGGERCMNMK